MKGYVLRVCPECDTRTEHDTCPKDGRQTVDEARLKIRSSDPNIGVVIENKYELVKRLGRGGMGAVYRATHKETGGSVAIKVMRADMVEEETSIKRFYIEAQNTHKLHHPNTVRVSDFGQTDDGILFLVMELVQGQSLHHVLKSEGRLAPSRAVRVLQQVLKSLGEAHEHGVVHRDIKPDNVMLIDQFGEPDFVKVLDFGISRTLEGTGASTKGAIGTPKYMAPEQWRGERIDARVDLYACGCMLYRMLTGRLPFEIQGQGSHQVVGYMTAHINDPPVPLSERIPGVVPKELDELMLSLMAKAREDRPEDARAVLKRLRWIEKHTALSDEVVLVEERLEQASVHSDEATRALPEDEVRDEASESSSQISNASATGFPHSGLTAQPTVSPVAVTVAVAATVLGVAGIVGWLAFGTTSTTPETAPPAAVAEHQAATPSPSDPSAPSDEGQARPVNGAAVPDAGRLLTLMSTPQGATVRDANLQANARCDRDPRGCLIGTTPITLTLPPGIQAPGDAPKVVLPDGTREVLSRVLVSHDGFEHQTLDLEFPANPGAEGTTALVLQPLPVVSVGDDYEGLEVRIEETEDILGKTPFRWTVPADVARNVRTGEIVQLEFLTRSGPKRVTVTADHLDGQKLDVGLQKRLAPKDKSRPRKKARPGKKRDSGKKPPASKSKGMWDF